VSRKIGALSSFIACALMAAAAAAEFPDSSFEERPFELTADSVEYERARRIYVARGNVRMVSRDTELTADWMAFSDVQSRGVAAGDVVYRAAGDVLVAEFIEFNIDTGRGILFGGRFRSGENQFRMEGEEVVKHGDDTYSFEKGMFTTCRCPPGERDPWQIRAGSADLEVGGYGTARNTTFEILGVPVVWLPWMIYPLKTERQSGLLFPEFGYGSRNGVDIGLPIFWAARDNLNITLTPRWLSKRGAKGDLEVEYVFGERSEGEISGSFLYDEDIEANSPQDPYDRERWVVHGEQDVFLPYSWRLKSDFQFISDNEYLVDFDDLPEQRNDRFLQSNAFLGRSFGEDGRFGALAGAVYADDLQNPDDQDRDKFLLQRLPTLALAALPAAAAESLPVLSRIIPSFDAEYTYFVPRRRAVKEFDGLPPDYYVGGVFIDTGIDAIPSQSERGFRPLTDPDPNPDPHGDDAPLHPGAPELDGVFEEGEPLADDGHRVDFFPRLALPFRIGDFVEAYPEVGWHQTLYDTHFQGTEERHLLTTRLDLRSRLIRRFGGGMTHILEPRIGYALITDLGQNQADNPMFVPETAVPQQRVRQLDLSNVTLDRADRIGKFNGITYGVGNRIYGPSDEGGSRLIADFYISNEFRFNGSDFGSIFVGARAYPFKGAHLWANLGFDPEEARLSEALFQFSYVARAGHAVRISYRYLRDAPRFFEDFEFSTDRFDDFTESFTRINQASFFGRLAITQRWSVYYTLAYTFEDSLILVNNGGIEYVSKCRCWAAGFELGHDRTRGFRFNLVYRLLGMGKQLGYTGPKSFGLADLGLLDAF
jgi:lipopolysaccharide assembly outer membrane protein LptD (OstA)